MESNLLELKEVFCGYKKKLILKNVSLEIAQGEIVGIIGPNGCGKTTLLRAISGYLIPEKGEIYFKGRNLKEIPKKELARKIAVVSQNSSFDLKIKVIDFVLLGRIPYKGPFKFFEDDEDLRIALDCLSLMEIVHLKDEPISNLSGGEKQLVNITRALVQDPELLLLDEPTSHLDIAHQLKILNLLRRLNDKKNVTEIIVFHDLNLASEFCKRLILISDGEIVSDGSPNVVLSYKNIEEVYKTNVLVKENPLSSKPYVFLVFEEWMKK